ncbi:LAFE_0F17172g1_1 [Lachancea fermentati]|uniref:LAFE_0F17172g1_1 n=1 Tax=Lachancea fermentati TaxID=4955 RepID=A0A1G4MGA2_LACFM|nr:LAFE_0F17172g1_1 [Lachancea fermentati]
MGVPSLWEVFKDQKCGERLPFKKFVVDFYHANGRTPRLAIDAYSWLFECGFISAGDQRAEEKGYKTIDLAILSLLQRLSLLISMDVTFMLVFDGPMKPSFKNKFRNKKMVYDTRCEEAKDHSFEFDNHLRLHETFGTCGAGESDCGDYDFVQDEGLSVVKELLEVMNISFIDACSEGESECARFEKEGLVDYVVTNDSDAFVFGARKVLKNMSKYWEDLPATYSGPSKKKDGKDMMVTVIDIANISKWTQPAVLLYSVLLGADYSQGVRGMGSKKAVNLVLHSNPNFAEQFYQKFHENRKDVNQRRIWYKNFQKEVLEFCKKNSHELFGKDYSRSFEKNALQGWPPEYAVMYYLYPILNPHPDMSGFSRKFINISGSLNIQEGNFKKLESLLRTHQLRQVSDFGKWFHNLIHKMFFLKYILYGQKMNNLSSKKMKIVTEWDASMIGQKYFIPSWRIRYSTLFKGILEPPENSSPKVLENDQGEGKSSTVTMKNIHGGHKSPITAELKYLTSIPRALVPESNTLVKEYRAEIANKVHTSSRISPKKKSSKKTYYQKNNLDEFIKEHKSPKKAFPASSDSKDLLPSSAPERALFVDDNESDEIDEDSSLMIISETRLSPTATASSPKRLLELSPTHEENEYSSDDESPFKKQKMHQQKELNVVRRQLIFDNVIDLTVESETDRNKKSK